MKSHANKEGNARGLFVTCREKVDVSILDCLKIGTAGLCLLPNWRIKAALILNALNQGEQWKESIFRYSKILWMLGKNKP
jgi:hypothetical protein